MRVNVPAVLDALNRLKFSVLLVVFLGFLAYMFHAEIAHAFEYKLLHNDRVVKTIDNDYLIHRKLEIAMDTMQSDRAYIFRFHNGVQYYNGSHKNKMSCDYEVARPGVSLEAQNLQDIPVTLFPFFIMETIKEKMFYKDISKIDDTRTRLALEEQGIKGIVAWPYYRDGVLFAIVGFDYINRPLELTEACLPGVDRLANEVGDLLL